MRRVAFALSSLSLVLTFGRSAARAEVDYTFQDVSYEWVSGVNQYVDVDDLFDSTNISSVRNLGFTFQFWGSNYTQVWLSSKGLIGFSYSSSLTDTPNQDMPNPANPNNIAALFWDDLHPGLLFQGAVYDQVLGTAPNRRYVVEYRNIIPVGCINGTDLVAQAVFYEGTNQIQFNYQNTDMAGGGPACDRDFGRGATVGLENIDGTRAAKYSYEAPAVGNGKSIRFTPYCVDADHDGFSVCDGDCDDANPAVFPGQTETCNGIDDDCDGLRDEGFDNDLDSWTTCNGDCDDTNPGVNPEEAEVCNGRDDDCDGVVDDGWDLDGDGYTSCGGDCNDSNNQVNPSVKEKAGNHVDDNCNGQIDEATCGSAAGGEAGALGSVAYLAPLAAGWLAAKRRGRGSRNLGA